MTQESPTTEGQDMLYLPLCGREQQGRSMEDRLISEVIFYA